MLALALAQLDLILMVAAEDILVDRQVVAEDIREDRQPAEEKCTLPTKMQIQIQVVPLVVVPSQLGAQMVEAAHLTSQTTTTLIIIMDKTSLPFQARGLCPLSKILKKRNQKPRGHLVL